MIVPSKDVLILVQRPDGEFVNSDQSTPESEDLQIFPSLLSRTAAYITIPSEETATAFHNSLVVFVALENEVPLSDEIYNSPPSTAAKILLLSLATAIPTQSLLESLAFQLRPPSDETYICCPFATVAISCPSSDIEVDSQATAGGPVCVVHVEAPSVETRTDPKNSTPIIVDPSEDMAISAHPARSSAFVLSIQLSPPSVDTALFLLLPAPAMMLEPVEENAMALY